MDKHALENELYLLLIRYYPNDDVQIDTICRNMRKHIMNFRKDTEINAIEETLKAVKKANLAACK